MTPLSPTPVLDLDMIHIKDMHNKLNQALFGRYPSSSVDTLSDPDTKASGSSLTSPSIFIPRENPRQFFIRDSLPSTESSATPSGSASLLATPKDSFEEQATSRDANERRASPAANGTAKGKAKQAETSVSPQHSGGQVISVCNVLYMGKGDLPC